MRSTKKSLMLVFNIYCKKYTYHTHIIYQSLLVATCFTKLLQTCFAKFNINYFFPTKNTHTHTHTHIWVHSFKTIVGIDFEN